MNAPVPLWRTRAGQMEHELNSVTKFLELMEGIGPHLGMDEVTFLPDAMVWELRLRNGSVLQVAPDETGDEATLTSEIGTPAKERRLSFYEEALMFNGMSAETGGARMTLDGREGAIILMIDFSCRDLDLHRFGKLAESFAGIADAWRGILAAGPDEAPPPAADSFPPTTIRL